MRRVPAILLLAVFSFSLISPALFASETESNLPACCRRDGKASLRDNGNRNGVIFGSVGFGEPMLSLPRHPSGSNTS